MGLQEGSRLLSSLRSAVEDKRKNDADTILSQVGNVVGAWGDRHGTYVLVGFSSPNPNRKILTLTPTPQP